MEFELTKMSKKKTKKHKKHCSQDAEVQKQCCGGPHKKERFIDNDQKDFKLLTSFVNGYKQKLMVGKLSANHLDVKN